MELDWSVLLLIFFCLLVVVLASGMPVAIGFLTLNILGLYFFMGGEVALSLLATSAFSSVGQFVLIPVPLFILMGELLMRTGLANMTVDAVDHGLDACRAGLRSPPSVAARCSVR